MSAILRNCLSFQHLKISNCTATCHKMCSQILWLQFHMTITSLDRTQHSRLHKCYIFSETVATLKLGTTV